MTDPHDWADANGRYLSAAMDWLRLRLEREARRGGAVVRAAAPAVPAAPLTPNDEGLAPAPVRGAPASGASTGGWRFFRRASDAAPAAPVPKAAQAALPEPPTLLLPPGDDVLEKQLEAAAKAMEDTAAISPPPALRILRDRAGLSRFEEHVLLLCIGAELDTRVAPLCGAAQGDLSKTHPTFALALAMFDDPSWDALSPERPLRYWRLLEIHQPGAQPLTASALRADERIVAFAKGLNYPDDRLAPLLWPLVASDVDATLPPSQRAVADTIVARVRSSREPPIVELLGSDELSKQTVAHSVAEALGRIAYRLPADSLPASVAELESLARLWQRETALLPLALYVDAHDTPNASEGAAPPAAGTSVARFVGRAAGLIFLATREAAEPSGLREIVRAEVAKPTFGEQREAWLHALTADAAADSPAPNATDLGSPAARRDAERLAAQFDLAAVAIQRVADAARAAPEIDRTPLADRLWTAAVDHARPKLDTLAQRIDPKATWEELVLPPQEERALRALGAQVRQRATVYEDWGFARRMNRGLGISALFAGESGTGKTMAAEVIANDLRLALYRVDLSAVVSKYIGETEKNLRRVFDAAEGGGAILFFDEADALFGKRSEVKDSHDRYANIEINYLLQRMEAYRGVAILATNMKTALDTAFMRRLRFIVTFPFPGAAERRRIWRSALPEGPRVGALDYDRLARLPLSGGSIQNVALAAAFLAADASSKVTMPVVLDAARAELRKLDLAVNEADLRWAEPVAVEEVA